MPQQRGPGLSSRAGISRQAISAIETGITDPRR
jgi:DNA-binding XRE family transcriptional regulator